MEKGLNVKCPTCKRMGDWFAGRYGPFCSHRCKLIDLGKWFSEEHAISEPLTQDSQDDRQQSSNEHLDEMD